MEKSLSFHLCAILPLVNANVLLCGHDNVQEMMVTVREIATLCRGKKNSRWCAKEARNNRLSTRMIGQRTNVYTCMFWLVFVCHKRARNGGSMCVCARNGSGKCKIRCCTNSLQIKVYSNVFCLFVLGLFGTNLIAEEKKEKKREWWCCSESKHGLERTECDPTT